MLVPH
jgi:hypothetical protein